MNKAELINAAAEKAGLSKKDTETAINAAIEVISDCLAEGAIFATLNQKTQWKSKFSH